MSAHSSGSQAYLSALRSWALRNLAIPGADLYYGQGLMSRLRFLEQAQWWTRDRLEAHRSDSLLKLVSIAHQEVPLYRDLMQRAGIAPGDIRGPRDLPRLPIVTPRMLREAYPHRTVRPTRQKAYETRSSGSTGGNTVVREDPETAGVYRSSFLLALQWAGWQFGEPHVQTGINPERSRGRNLKDLFLQCHYVSALGLTEQKADGVLDLIDRRHIQHLWGYPRSLYTLARRARQRGWNGGLRSVVTWGDNLYRHWRNTIEAAFGARVFDTYGCGEGFQVAAQCGHEQNYHIHSLDVIVELLDGDGQPVAPGQSGNVVITRLHPGPMPLIRYRVGDVAFRGPDEECPCGRTFERLGGIQGRDTEFVRTPSGERLMPHELAGLLEACPEVDAFQIVQNAADAVLVRVVPMRGLPAEEWRDKVVSTLRQKGLQELRIDLEMVDEIPRTPSGKRPLIINTAG